MISQNAINYAIQLIKEGQGFYKDVYKDTQEYWTIGIGHKLLPHEIGKLKTITYKEAEKMLMGQLQEAISKAKKYWGNHLNSMNAERTAVILDMTYNLGSIKWPKFTAAVHKCDWQTAGEEILDSKYADQVGARAIRNSEIMKDGKRHSKTQFQ